jgi:GT2 family glycosyltransferase
MANAVSASAVHFFVCVGGMSPRLFDCLESLDRQIGPDNARIGSIKLVWNCNQDEANAGINQLDYWLERQKFSTSLSHHFEGRRGIPYARNKALDVARQDGITWMAFIDDDCTADPRLVDTLVDVALNTLAMVVAGGWEVIPASEPSRWLPSGVFGVKHYAGGGENASSGEEIRTAYTRNVLFNLPRVDDLFGQKATFDESLALTGGSDATFFFSVSGIGGKIVYAPEAKVVETYDGERLTLAWYLRRRIRNTQQKILRARLTGEQVIPPGVAVEVLARLLWRIPFGVLILPLALFSDRVKRWIGATVLMSAPIVGFLLLLGGVRFREYASDKRWVLLRRNARDIESSTRAPRSS